MRLSRTIKGLFISGTILALGVSLCELYARHIGLYQTWSWSLKKIPYSARDNLKIWNRRFYEEKNSDFREWPIQIELFDASKSTPRYLFKPNLRMALRSDGKLQPAGSDERVYWSSNSLGFRGPEIPFVKAAGALRVVCLGASTTEGVQSDDETYPHFLQQELDVVGRPCCRSGQCWLSR